MNRFSFWQAWLFVASLVIVAFGLALALFNQTAPFDWLFNDRVNRAFWSSPDVPAAAASFQQWIYGVLGATVAGWGVVIAFIARDPFARRERWAWNGLALSLLAWFIPDTALSLRFGVTVNAILNLLLFVIVLLPLAFTRQAFVAGATTQWP